MSREAIDRESESICPDCRERLRDPAFECGDCYIFKSMKEYMKKRGD